jgi:hypothetical protein
LFVTCFEGPVQTIQANVVDARQGDRLGEEALADDTAEGLLHVVEPGLLVALERNASLPEGSVQLKVVKCNYVSWNTQ